MQGASQAVLIIDDAADNRQALGELLAGDHTVLLAANGPEGLAMAARHKPDLILLDVVMPGMNGYEVLKHLKADPRTAGIAIIFITGLDRPEDEARSLQMGGSDFITKPFSPPVVCARVAVHLRLARHHRQMEELANIDALTGIPNRRQFDEILLAECRRAQRGGHPVAVALVDIDFFKQYNDRYGHAMGDHALRAVANMLQQCMRRPGDLAARYGGEEFALVMADTTPSQARALVETLCSAVEALGIPHEDSKAAHLLTISAGVISSDDAEHLDPDTLLQRADERLYMAKAAGRNRVMSDRF